MKFITKSPVTQAPPTVNLPASQIQVLDFLRRYSESSAFEIALALNTVNGIPIRTVEYSINRLIKIGLVRPGKPQAHGRGRPARRFYLNFGSPEIQAMLHPEKHIQKELPQGVSESPEKAPCQVAVKVAVNLAVNPDRPEREMHDGKPPDTPMDTGHSAVRETEKTHGSPISKDISKRKREQSINYLRSKKKGIISRLITRFEAERRDEGMPTIEFYASRHIWGWLLLGFREAEIIDRISWFFQRSNAPRIARSWPLFMSQWELIGDEIAGEITMSENKTAARDARIKTLRSRVADLNEQIEALGPDAESWAPEVAYRNAAVAELRKLERDHRPDPEADRPRHYIDPDEIRRQEADDFKELQAKCRPPGV